MRSHALALSLSLSLFAFGMLGASLVFWEVQVMNTMVHIGNVTLSARGYPWWSERVAEQTCILGQNANLNCGFLNYAQVLLISLAASALGFIGLTYYSEGGSRRGAKLMRSIGLTLFVFGLVVAVVVFAEVQTLNSLYSIGGTTVAFQGYPYGGQEVLGSACIVGTDTYHCYFFSYDELLYSTIAGSFLGFVLWQYVELRTGLKEETREEQRIRGNRKTV